MFPNITIAKLRTIILEISWNSPFQQIQAGKHPASSPLPHPTHPPHSLLPTQLLTPCGSAMPRCPIVWESLVLALSRANTLFPASEWFSSYGCVSEANTSAFSHLRLRFPISKAVSQQYSKVQHLPGGMEKVQSPRGQALRQAEFRPKCFCLPDPEHWLPVTLLTSEKLTVERLPLV